MALRGVDVVFIPHASPRGTPEEKLRSWLRHLRARAFDNSVYVVACNQVGENREGLSFPGGAVVLDPGGRIVARHEGCGEEILTATLATKKLMDTRAHRMRYFLPHRRPELYGEILK
jgi:N-carbamoylputrescine amidase